MTGATGTPSTPPAQDTTKAAKPIQGSTASGTGATADPSQPAADKILEASPPTTTSSAPRPTSGSQIETATTLPGGTGSSRMDMGGVGGSSRSTTSNTILGSNTGRDQQDRRGQSESLAETASQ